MKNENKDLKINVDKNLDEPNISEEDLTVKNVNFKSEPVKIEKQSSEYCSSIEPEVSVVDDVIDNTICEELSETFSGHSGKRPVQSSAEVESKLVSSEDLNFVGEDDLRNIEDASPEGSASKLLDNPQTVDNSFVPRVKKSNTLKVVGIVLGFIWLCFLVLVIWTSVSGNDSKKVVSDGGIINVSDSGSNKDNTLKENNVSGERELLSAADIYEKSINSVVAIQTEKSVKNIFGQYSTALSAGTGFIITDTGYVLTNNHVIDGASNITVIMNNNTVYKAHFVGGDVKNDVAILALEVPLGTKFTPLTLGSIEGSRVGDDILVIGNPLGELTNSMTRGIISAKDRQISVEENIRMEVVQIDAPINQGNSGGPLLNYYGEVIGIVSAKYASDTIEGLGFCIPIDSVKLNLQTIIDSGEVINTQPYLGISVTTVTDDLSAYLNMPYGAYVAQVVYGSPAYKSGILQGDVITELEGKAVAGSETLIALKNKYKIGDKITLKVFRGGKYQDIIVELGETPANGVVPQNPNEQGSENGKEGNIPPANNEKAPDNSVGNIPRN